VQAAQAKPPKVHSNTSDSHAKASEPHGSTTDAHAKVPKPHVPSTSKPQAKPSNAHASTSDADAKTSKKHAATPKAHANGSTAHATATKAKPPAPVKKAAPASENGLVKVEKDVSKTAQKILEGNVKKEEKEKAGASKPARAHVAYDMPGQTRPKPDEEDPLTVFYTSLLKQRPDSELAKRWYGITLCC
jgi:hypothetical protein